MLYCQRDQVKQGRQTASVGTTANAPEKTPALYFAILLLTDKKEWRQAP